MKIWPRIYCVEERLRAVFRFYLRYVYRPYGSRSKFVSCSLPLAYGVLFLPTICLVFSRNGRVTKSRRRTFRTSHRQKRPEHCAGGLDSKNVERTAGAWRLCVKAAHKVENFERVGPRKVRLSHVLGLLVAGPVAYSPWLPLPQPMELYDTRGGSQSNHPSERAHHYHSSCLPK